MKNSSRGEFTQLDKEHLQKTPTTNILNSTLQGCLRLPMLFNIMLEFVARAVRQTKEIKGI